MVDRRQERSMSATIALSFEHADIIFDALIDSRCFNQEMGRMPGADLQYWEEKKKAIDAAYFALQLATGALPNVAALAPAPLSAFVTVPATTLPGGHIEPSFEVGRYLCSKGAGGAAVIDAALPPWVSINYADARAACTAAGFNLITERQALALAINIAGVAANWTGGAVGEGSLHQGLRNDSVDSAQPGDFVPADADEQRWFELSNGERICDAAGNAFSWVFDNVQGDEQGLVAHAFAADSPSIASAPHASLERGVGWRPDAGRDWSGCALFRGGCFLSGDYAGVFRLGGGWPDGAYVLVGFRCTK
jgi:hypothetical protein